MNAELDRRAAENAALRGQPKHTITHGVLTWGPEFRALMDNQTVLPYLRALCGDKIRLDHDYAIFMTPGGSGLRLHGGATALRSHAVLSRHAGQNLFRPDRHGLRAHRCAGRTGRVCLHSRQPQKQFRVRRGHPHVRAAFPDRAYGSREGRRLHRIHRSSDARNRAVAGRAYAPNAVLQIHAALYGMGQRRLFYHAAKCVCARIRGRTYRAAARSAGRAERVSAPPPAGIECRRTSAECVAKRT